MTTKQMPPDGLQRKHFRAVNQTANDYLIRLREPLRDYLLKKILSEIRASGPCFGDKLDAVVADALDVSSLESAIGAVAAEIGGQKSER